VRHPPAERVHRLIKPELVDDLSAELQKSIRAHRFDRQI
jgi:hypothetical protein